MHPGEVLREEFLKPLGLTGNRLALSIGVDAGRISQILRGRRAITAETALRLALFFGNSPEFWMGLQTRYDLDVAEQTVGERVRREVRALPS
jgi:addiction module HigA family antidote